MTSSVPYSRKRSDRGLPSYVIRLLKYQSQRFALCTRFRAGIRRKPGRLFPICTARLSSSLRLDEVIKDAAAISGASRANELEQRTSTRGMHADFLWAFKLIPLLKKIAHRWTALSRKEWRCRLTAAVPSACTVSDWIRKIGLLDGVRFRSFCSF